MKLRGQRIELGEIEHALRTLPGVDEAVVLVHADALVAYVSPAEVVHANGTGTGEARAEEARAEEADDAVPAAVGESGFGTAVPFGRVPALAGAAAALPAYMLPSVVVGVREWPRTSSAKIDRRRLLPPVVQSGCGVQNGDEVAEVVAPRTAAEAVVCDAVAAVAGLTQVSVEAHLFDELCMNSLAAAVLARRLEALCAADATVRVIDVYDHPSVRQLASWAATKHGLTCNVPSPTNASSEITPPRFRVRLVQMRDGTPGHPPVLLVPGGLRSTELPFRHLAALLPAQYPVYALTDNSYESGWKAAHSPSGVRH